MNVCFAAIPVYSSQEFGPDGKHIRFIGSHEISHGAYSLAVDDRYIVTQVRLRVNLCLCTTIGLSTFIVSTSPAVRVCVCVPLFTCVCVSVQLLVN